jgi:hypothetical protein
MSGKNKNVTPPNKANINIQGPLIASSQVLKDFFSAGLTANDLKPVDWSTNANPVGRRLTSPVRNQEQCGNCWAMSSTAVLTDRYIVQSALAGKKVGSGSLKLQPAITTQCTIEFADKGCNGGAPYYAGKYFEITGIPSIVENEPRWSDICADGCSNIKSCADLIPEFKTSMLWNAKENSTVATLAAANEDKNGQPDGTVDTATTILNIKKALINGPVIGQMYCPNDFMYDNLTCNVWTKTGGVYINGSYNNELDSMYSGQNPTVSGKAWSDIQMEGANPSAHAVEVVGWGNDGDHGPYWIVKNTWGESWNGDGFFKYGMYPNNKYLGLDIPVTDAIQASTGKSLANVSQGSKDVSDFYGSCVSFEPKGQLGDDGNYLSYNDHVSPRRAPISKKKKILLFIIMGCIIIAGLYLLIRRNKKKR